MKLKKHRFFTPKIIFLKYIFHQLLFGFTPIYPPQIPRSTAKFYPVIAIFTIFYITPRHCSYVGWVEQSETQH